MTTHLARVLVVSLTLMWEPARAVHVGDDAASDVAGARGVGMRAIHFVPDPSVPGAAADAVLRRFADLPALVARLG